MTPLALLVSLSIWSRLAVGAAEAAEQVILADALGNGAKAVSLSTDISPFTGNPRIGPIVRATS